MIQKHIIGCWKRDFDQILSTNYKNKSLIGIYRWTCWANHWQPTQSRWVGRFPSSCTEVVISGLLHTRATNLAKVWFGPVPGPKVMVQHRCKPSRRPWRNECQRFLVLHHCISAWQLVPAIHKCGIGYLCTQKRQPHAPCRMLIMSVNSVLTNVGHGCRVIQKRFGCYYTHSK